MWVNRHKLNNSLLVFIHGIFGDYWDTWKGIPDILQSEAERKPENDEAEASRIRSYDVYLFRYSTGSLTRGLIILGATAGLCITLAFFGVRLSLLTYAALFLLALPLAFRRQPALYPEVANDLDRFLERHAARYQTVVLVCHSQGGILAKLFVLDKLRQGQGLTLAVNMIVTIDTPHRGHWLLVPLYVLYRILKFVRLDRFFPLRQLADLASWSANIRTLARDWNTRYISPEPVPPETHLRHLRSVAIIGAYDLLVGKRSAAGFYVDNRIIVPESHRSAAKPKSRSEPVAQELRTELRKHADPEGHLKRIAAIRADQSQFAEYIRAFAPSAYDLVQQIRPGLGEEAILRKAFSLLADFLNDFEQRPLRNLSFDAAVLEYVRRQLQPEAW